MVLLSTFNEGVVETGYAEPPHQVDIAGALRALGVSFYDHRRMLEIYLRYIRGKDIYDGLSIRELEQSCRDRGISLQHMPSIPPGPKSHPWVQEGFKRLHTRLVEALEASEAATTFHKFLDLEKGIRLKICNAYYDQMMDLNTLTGDPAIAKTSHMVRKEALSVYFDRYFELHTRTDDPSMPVYVLPAPPIVTSGPSSKNFLKAPPSYTNRIRRLIIYRWVAPEGTMRADYGTWQIDLDARAIMDRVRWVPEVGHGDGFLDPNKRVKMQIAISDATLRLRKAVEIVMNDDGKLFKEDAKWLRNAIENSKMEKRPRS